MSRSDRTGRRGTAAPALAPWQPWAALAVAALALNFAWEMLQAPLYESMAGLSPEEATWICARASAGDAVITLASYGGVAALAGSAAWLMHARAPHVAAYLAVGLALSVALELANVYWLGRWTYGPRMPRVLGVGLAPLAQWLLVPPGSLWLARRYLRHTYPTSPH